MSSTLKHIRVFHTVYQEESVTGAARKLHMTQPATSLAIRELEEHYQTKLFERDGRGIRPTDAARHLYPFAARLLSLYKEMEDEMKDLDTTGRVRIGSSISIGSCLLPSLISSFRSTHPQIDLYVKVDSSDVIEQKLLENELDLALLEGNIHSSQLFIRTFSEDSLVPICSPSHPLAQATEVPLDRLYREQFLMREPNSGTRQFVNSCFEARGFTIQPAWESTSTAALIHAVSANLGISILPRRMLEDQIRAGQISTFRIQGMDLTRHYYLVYHRSKYLTPAMQDFITLLGGISH